MSKKNVYSRLIEHLGSRLLDLPDSESRIRLVEATFSPEEAEFLSSFPFRPQSIERLAENFNIPVDELKPKLDSFAERGILFWRQSAESVEYALNEPWFIFYRGSYWAGKRDERTKKIARHANRYYHSGMGHQFGAYPTMTLRAIPIQRTIQDTRQILPYENVAEIVQGEDYICVGHCPCRQMKNIDPDTPSCKHETLNCLHFGPLARYMVKQGMGQVISGEETMEILMKAADAGLVHGISNRKAGQLDSICNCCSCCCVFVQSANVLGLHGHHKSNYIPQVNKETCKGCGLCVERCSMKSLCLESSSEANNKVDKVAVLDPRHCIGCGVCAHKCPTHSLQLVHRKGEQDVPHNISELIERQVKERGKKLYT
ncbi:MAG: 4Fe-4S binding protein [Deltaproteobacteria bacterium]|nr:4Fe-4S binding protein [Deltaproteobacteria bacterium]